MVLRYPASKILYSNCVYASEIISKYFHNVTESFFSYFKLSVKYSSTAIGYEHFYVNVALMIRD